MKYDRVNVLFLVSTLRRSGPTRQILNILRHLDPQQFDSRLLTLSTEPAESMQSEFEACGVPVQTLGMSRRQSIVTCNWTRTLEGVLARPVDRTLVVHSHGIRADGIAANYLKRASCLSTMHNYPYHDYPTKYGNVLGHLMALNHLHSLRRLAQVVACSSTICRLTRAHGIQATVIRNGVATDRLTPVTESERRRLRAKFRFDDNLMLVVSAGTLRVLKDPLTVVRALRNSRNPDWRLVLIGSGPLEKQCAMHASSDSRIILTGQISNVEDYLRCADVFVSASRSEGMPNAVLEAMACGLGVVLSDIPAHREILEIAPSTGTLFAVGNEVALHRALEQALRGDLHTVGRRSRCAAERHFNSHAMSCAYQTIYAAVAQANSHA